MSKRKKYYINDGLDGILIGRSINHAINIIRRNGYNHFTKQEIKKSIKTEKEVNGCGWSVEVHHGNYKKSMMLGWCE
jgi:hypothetical protein